MNDKKVWLITGAGRGMGADIARAALTAGMAVVATGRDGDRIAAAPGQSDNLLSVTLDGGPCKSSIARDAFARSA